MTGGQVLQASDERQPQRRAFDHHRVLNDQLAGDFHRWYPGLSRTLDAMPLVAQLPPDCPALRVPETKDKSPEQIEADVGGLRPCRLIIHRRRRTPHPYRNG